ncbi:MAG: U32 family peptidase [Dehalococcoidia bacterium]|nr:U32 family peptidase [Dehalococcoidia bacterium]
MAGLEFSVPYNNDLETLDELFKLKELNGNRIREVYLSGPQRYSASGRIVEEIDEAKLVSVMSLIHAEGIRVNLVMNPTCEGLDWYEKENVKEKMEFLTRMHKEHGLEAVTIANPLFVEYVKETLPDIEIGVSVLGGINSTQGAVIYEKLGATVVTPDVDCNRDIEQLKQLKLATKLEFKLMVNEGCLYKCPFRRFHFNYISHKSKELGPVENDSFFAHCAQVTDSDHSQILKSGWIRPEDLEKYGEITHFFKIVGRARPKSMVIRTTKAYMNQRWDGDLMDILSSSLNRYSLEVGAHLDNNSLSRFNFFEKVTTCDHACLDCDYCSTLAKDLITLQTPTRGKLEDLGLTQLIDEMERRGKLAR